MASAWWEAAASGRLRGEGVAVEITATEHPLRARIWALRVGPLSSLIKLSVWPIPVLVPFPNISVHCVISYFPSQTPWLNVIS